MSSWSSELGDDRFDGSDDRSSELSYNVITRLVSDEGWVWEAEQEHEGLHVAKREAAYFDILIGESECGNPRGGVCNLTPSFRYRFTPVLCSLCPFANPLFRPFPNSPSHSSSFPDSTLLPFYHRSG